MKKAIVGGLVGLMSLTGLAWWVLAGHAGWGIKDLFFSGLAAALVALAVCF